MGNDYHSDERSYIEEIRSRYEGQGLTKSADQAGRLTEALTNDLENHGRNEWR